ncbi:MAG: hypothetical protein V9E96_05025 [Chitinophagaceae bacterium]
MNRRNFLNIGSTFLTSIPFVGFKPTSEAIKPIVISTWDAGLKANEAAWAILSKQWHSFRCCRKRSNGY